MITAIKAKQLLFKLGSQGWQLNFMWKRLEGCLVGPEDLPQNIVFLNQKFIWRCLWESVIQDFFWGGEESNVCFPQSLSSSANTVEGIINVLAEFCKIRRNQAQEVLGEEVCHQQPTCWTYKGQQDRMWRGAGWELSRWNLQARAPVVRIEFLVQEATRGL